MTANELKRIYDLYGAAGGHLDLCYWLDQAIRELEAGGSMTNEEFIRRLKKARKLALTRYVGEWRIFEGCRWAGIGWGTDSNNAAFGKGKWRNRSAAWLIHHGNTEANVRAVFDNSIKALGGKP